MFILCYILIRFSAALKLRMEEELGITHTADLSRLVSDGDLLDNLKLAWPEEDFEMLIYALDMTDFGNGLYSDDSFSVVSELTGFSDTADDVDGSGSDVYESFLGEELASYIR